jgi:hypothetical protein
MWPDVCLFTRILTSDFTPTCRFVWAVFELFAWSVVQEFYVLDIHLDGTMPLCAVITYFRSSGSASLLKTTTQIFSKRREATTYRNSAISQMTWMLRNTAEGTSGLTILFLSDSFQCVRLRLKCDGTRAETRFRLSAKRTSPFKSAGASVHSTAGSRGVRISGSNAGYTMFRDSVKSTGYPLHSPLFPSLSLPCVTVCHHISTGLYSHPHPFSVDTAFWFLNLKFSTNF